MSVSQPDPQTLVILGVADKDLLKQRIKANGRSYSRTLIVDPECESVAHLIAGAECIEAAAGGSDQPKRMQWFNMPGLRSTRDIAPALKRLLPGLTVTKAADVQGISVPAVLGKLDDTGFDIWIDMPGDEADVLNAVLADPSSKRIASLKIRTEAEEYFQGSAPQQDVQNTLASHHFAVKTTDTSDPDWPDLNVEPDALVREVEDLRTQLAEAAGQIEDLKKQVVEKGNALDDYKDLTAKNAELSKQLDAEKKAHNAAKAARQNERVAVAEAHEKAARLEQNYRAARQDLSTALQQQTMTQANFVDLQQRYNKLADDNRKFAELLGQLQPRLVEAAQQLRSTDKRLDAPKAKRAKPSKKTKV